MQPSNELEDKRIILYEGVKNTILWTESKTKTVKLSARKIFRITQSTISPQNVFLSDT
jgi:hypothetical protein